MIHRYLCLSGKIISIMISWYIYIQTHIANHTKTGLKIDCGILIILLQINCELYQNFADFFNTYRIIPNNAPPPVFDVPCIPRKSDGLKKSTRHQPSACSRVNNVEPLSVCCERGCKRGMLLLHVAKLLYTLF